MCIRDSLWAAGHRPQNFYMLGSMGLTFPIALGVALAQPKRRVFALEGDGSLLMQMGCLATIATQGPRADQGTLHARPRRAAGIVSSSEPSLTTGHRKSV